MDLPISPETYQRLKIIQIELQLACCHEVEIDKVLQVLLRDHQILKELKTHEY